MIVIQFFCQSYKNTFGPYPLTISEDYLNNKMVQIFILIKYTYNMFILVPRLTRYTYTKFFSTKAL